MIYSLLSLMTKHKAKAPKSTFGKVWHFIWHDDSWLSWIVNIIIAFVLIKFIIYPVIGFIFGTGFPVVAVISDSMEHDGSFNDWWGTQSDYYGTEGISYDQFKEEFSFRNGFNRGDIMILFGGNFSKINLGDVIVFTSSRPYPIIHRVIDIHDDKEQRIVETKGDHNADQIVAIGLDESNIDKSEYLGKAVLRIPYVGFVKIWFAELMSFIGLGAVFV